MHELYQYLSGFYPIGMEDFHLLFENFSGKSFKKNEHIIVPGQTQTHLYFIGKGVQMSYHEGESKSHVIAFTYPPNLCAIPESFSFQRPSSYYLSCLTETSAHGISYENLQKVFDQSHQIERLFRVMTEVVLAGMIFRHIELHSLSIEQRFKAFCNRSPHLLQLVPHKYIASYLGMDSTNFSKLYNQVKI
ncbi:MAG: Crp/Fnr family transcriptional regulator [Saprospiraceae bacterium]|nr:Crp/Fnr family transcriptional regulator [Saprospiraceae bacterium]